MMRVGQASSSSPQLTVDALILSRNRPQPLRRLIGCLLQQDRQLTNILIIDNYDEPGACERAISGLQTETRVRIIRPPSPVGTATGRNLLIDASSSDLCLFLDDDMAIHDPGAISLLVAGFEADGEETLGAITFRAAGLGSGSPRGLRLGSLVFDLAKRPFMLRAHDAGRVSRSHFQSSFQSRRSAVEWLQGGATMARRRAAEDIRFDPRLELVPLAIGEDLDFGFRMSRRWRLEYMPDVQGYNGHSRVGGMGASWLTPRDKAYVTVRNYRYLAKKNLPSPVNSAASWWSLVGLGLAYIAMATASRTPASWDSVKGWAAGMRDAALLGERDRPHAEH